MKYVTQNMPNIVSLENGNEAAVRHKRTCSTICVPNSPCSETGVFKNTLRKVMSSVTVSAGLACVASVSARICRESWDESNNSIGNAYYAGYRRMRVEGWLFREKNARLVSFKK